MRTVTRFACLIATIWAVAACSSKKEAVNPAPAENPTLVLIAGARDQAHMLTAVDGSNGREVWTVPFEGQVVVGGRRLFLNDWSRTLYRLASYQDTVALYNHQDTLSNLLQVGAMSGKVVSLFNTQLRPNYMVECCSNKQTNELLGVSGESAVMLLTEQDWLVTIQAILYVKNMESGAIQWSRKISARQRIELLDGKVYVSSDEGAFAVDVNTGAKLKDYPYPGVFVATANMLCSIDGNALQAIDAQTGLSVWKFDASETLRVRGVHKHIVILEGSPDVLTDRPHTYYGIDMQTGQEKWRSSISAIPYYSNSAVHDGVFLLGGVDGTLYAVQAETGLPLWSKRMGNGLNGGYASQITARSGKVFFLANNRLVAFSLLNGLPLWEHLGANAAFLRAFDQTELDF